MRETIERLIGGAIAERIFPGAVALVARDGATLHHGAYGDTQYGDPGARPVGPDTIYDIASLTKVFTATAALTLALGIGVTSLMFGVVNAVLLRPLPYPDQDGLMLVFNVNTNDPAANTIRATALDLEDYRTRARTFEALAGHVGNGFTVTGGGDPELVMGQMVTPDFFGSPPTTWR